MGATCSISENRNTAGAHKVECLQCGEEHELKEAYFDDNGWFTVCPDGGGSFDVDLPHDSEKLQDLLGYIRATKIVYTADGCYEVYFKCDPGASTVNSEVDCQECPKEGCHMHTALMDAEKILCGEENCL